MNFILVGEKAKVSLVLAFLYEVVKKEEKIEVFDTNYEDAKFILNYKFNKSKLNIIVCKEKNVELFSKNVKVNGVIILP